MNFKKRFFLICGGCIFVTGVAIAGIMIGKSSFFQEREKTGRYYIDNMDTNIDKNSLYHAYIIKTLVEAIKDEKGIMDCKIDVNYSNDEIVSAKVSIVAEDGENYISEASILDYISQYLEISTENIVVSFD